MKSGAIASRLRAVSSSVSPLTKLERGRGEVDRVGRQALFGQLERRARARRGLDEEVDDRLAAQRRDLLDLARADLGEALRGVEDQRDLLRRRARAMPSRCGLRSLIAGASPPAPRRARAAQQHAPRPRRRSPAAAPRPCSHRGRRRSSRRSRRGSAARGARDRRARRAGSRAGRPRSISAVERRADRAPGEQHVVDEHDARRRRRSKGISVWRSTGWSAIERQVVAVQVDVEDAGGRRASSEVASSAAARRRGERHAARADADQRRRAIVLLRLHDLVGDARQRAGDGFASMTRTRLGRGCIGVSLRPHRAGLKRKRIDRAG